MRTVRIDDDLWLQILALAELHHVGVQDIVTVALNEFLSSVKGGGDELANA